MNAAGSDNFGYLAITGKYSTAVTVSTKWLGWEKTGARHIGKLADRTAVQLCAKALRRIVDKPQIMCDGKSSYCIIVGWLAEQPYADNANYGSDAHFC